MPNAQNDVKSVFDQAVEIESPEDRREWLDRHCADDAELREEVGKLLRAYENTGSFLQYPLSPTVMHEPVTEEVGAVIGPYKLREQIGEGGMGVVYVAEQTKPVRRKVALKLIKPGMDTKQVIARFEAERQALALMDHPNIAHVIDGGTTESERPFFVMELVRGLPVTRYCDEHQLTMRQRLELFVTVCRSVQHAHQKGIIHRDIKPSNVLVTRIDGTPVPKVIDFGVAKAVNQQLTERTIYTQFAEMIGTPAYMSPEQAELTSQDIDTRSDVYSLGVLLYELLTGCTPFGRETLKQASPVEKLRMIREDEPRKPSARLSTLKAGELSTIAKKRGTDAGRLDDFVKEELDWIVMRAMEKDRSRRYESASALAADIDRYLRNEPVEACPPTAWYRFRKFAARNKGLIGTWMAVSAALLSGAGISIWQAIEANDARRLADNRFAKMNAARASALEAKTTAERNSTYSRQLVYAANIALAARAQQDGDVRRFTDLLDRHIPKGGSTDLRGFGWRYLRQFARAEYRTIAKGTGGSIVARFSRDGEYIASGRHDGTIHLWDGKTDKYLFSLPGHQDYVRDLDFSPDGKRLASTGYDGFVRVWDLAQRKEIVRIHAYKEKHGYGVRFGLGGNVVVSNGESDTAGVWDSRNGDRLGTFMKHKGQIDCLDVSPDGQYCVTAANDGFAVWDLKLSKKVRDLFRLAIWEPGPWCVRYSPNGSLIAGATSDRKVKIWIAKTGQLIAVFPGHESKILDLAFHLSGRLLASSDKAGIVRTWPVSSAGKWNDRDIGSPVWWCEYLRDGRLCIRVWNRVYLLDPRTNKLIKVPMGKEKNLGHDVISISKNRDLLLCKKDLYSIAGNDPKKWHRILTLRHGFKDPTNAVLSPDGKLIATGSNTGFLLLFEVDGKSAKLVQTHSTGQAFTALRFSDDGKWLASGHKNGDIIIWNVGQRRFHLRLEGGKGYIMDLAFLPNRKWIVSSAGDFARVWDIETGRQIKALRHPRLVVALAFSPDGRLLATQTHQYDNLLRIFDTDTWKIVQIVRVREKDAEKLSFSPDSRYLALCGWQSRKLTRFRVRVPALRKPWPNTISAHNTRAFTVDFSPDGKRLITASKDGTIRSWPALRRRKPRFELPRIRNEDAKVVAFANNGRNLFLSGDWDLAFWNSRTQRNQQLVQRFPAEANWMALCRKKGWIATAHQDGKVRVWNSSGKLKTTIEAHKQSIRRVAFSNDGRLLATASYDGFARLWNAVSKKQMAEFRMGHTCANVAFSSNGKLLAGCWGDNAFLFDTRSQKQVHLLEGHQNSVECVVFSPDGRLLATGSHDRTIQIWNVETGRRLHVIAAHRSEVRSVVFSPDGGTIVSGDIAGQIAFSHVATGQLLFTETIAKNTVRQLVFSPDGNTLAVSAHKTGVILLHAPPIETNRKPLSR